jgi:hypothetical protein
LTERIDSSPSGSAEKRKDDNAISTRRHIKQVEAIEETWLRRENMLCILSDLWRLTENGRREETREQRELGW